MPKGQNQTVKYCKLCLKEPHLWHKKEKKGSGKKLSHEELVSKATQFLSRKYKALGSFHNVFTEYLIKNPLGPKVKERYAGYSIAQSKLWRIDTVGVTGNRKICVECGFTPKFRIEALKRIFDEVYTMGFSGRLRRR